AVRGHRARGGDWAHGSLGPRIRSGNAWSSGGRSHRDSTPTGHWLRGRDRRNARDDRRGPRAGATSGATMNRAKSSTSNRNAAIAPSAERGEAERVALAELEQWRRRAIPDENTPLEADDLVTLLRDCVAALGLDADIANDVSISTIHYYRRKDIIDPP